MAETPVRAARFDQLTGRELYGLLKLRSDVFIVEQACIYADMDGRDLEPNTLHVWLEDEGVPVSSLRVLDNGDVRRIGRVCTLPSYRSRGLAAVLIRHVMHTVGPPLFLGAQVHLEEYYARFGFAVCGSIWDENGIPHLPMRWDG
ncbi:MAG: GNAT family N-acetyltransferase [Candidatus Dormibacteraeota bacterium]|nr:GNAT family N-acetyltransferase [Candidatus Dormibacteraeota bacterium]